VSDRVAQAISRDNLLAGAVGLIVGGGGVGLVDSGGGDMSAQRWGRMESRLDRIDDRVTDVQEKIGRIEGQIGSE